VTDVPDLPADPAAEALAAVGGSLVLGRIVTGGPDGEVRVTVRVADGAVTQEAGLSDEAEVVLTDTWKNLHAMAEGELDPNAAFMRGQTKVAGRTGRLLDLLAAASGDGGAASRPQEPSG
jgi:hypothetical protein